MCSTCVLTVRGAGMGWSKRGVVWELVGSTAEQVVRGGVDIEQATRALDHRVNAILEKRRWMLARRKPE